MPTPVYNLRFPGTNDPPNGPQQIQDLAEDIEATLQGNLELGGSLEIPTDLAVGDDASVSGDLSVAGTLNFSSTVMRPQQAENDADLTSLANDATAPAAGSPVVGVTFTVPPSGMFWVKVTGRVRSAQLGCLAQLGWQLRTGTTIGSGTIILDISTNRAVRAGVNVVSGGEAEGGPTDSFLVTAQTPGASVNISTRHWGAGSSIGYSILYRRIAHQPVA